MAAPEFPSQKSPAEVIWYIEKLEASSELTYQAHAFLSGYLFGVACGKELAEILWS